MIKNKFYSNLMLVICLLSGFLNIVYVFWDTPYKSNFMTDCGWFWHAAINRFDGRIFDEGQWNLKPPFYHIILTEIFKVLYLFGLLSWKLEAVLLLQIILGTLSVYVLYRIALGTSHDHLASLLAASSYAFSFVLIYFKSLILSENMAIPFLIFSIWFIFYPTRRHYPFIGGLLLGVATGIRPSFGVMAIPFALYVFFYDKAVYGRFKRLGGFLLGFMLVVILLASEYNYISHGRRSTVAPNSGAIIFDTFVRPHGLECQGVIMYAWQSHPSRGMYHFQEPFYHTRYYLGMTMDFIRKNPALLINRFFFIKSLFFSPLMPPGPGALFFKPLLAFSRGEMLGMFLISSMVWIVFKSKRVDKAKLLVLIFLPASFLIGFFFFVTEYRYFYSFAFVIHITCFLVLAEVFRIINARKAHEN